MPDTSPAGNPVPAGSISSQRAGLFRRWIGPSLLLLLAVSATVWALANWLPPAYDMHTFFYPAIHDWLNGRFSDANWPDLNYTPWELMFFLPFALTPEPIGRALFLLFAVIVIIWATKSVRRRRLALALILISFPVLAMFWEGNLEPFPILGIALSAWAIRERRPWIMAVGLPLLATKPQEVFLITPVMVWAIRRWRWDEWARVMAGPILVLLLTVTLFEGGWLSKLAQAPSGYQTRWNWINISIWWRFAPYGIALAGSILLATVGVCQVARLRFDRYALGLALALGTVASPYVATHHLIVPLVFAWPWLLDRHLVLGLIVYLTTLTPLARWQGDQTLNWLDFAFPVVLTISLLLFYREQRQAHAGEVKPDEHLADKTA